MKALAHMHANNIIHRDVKLENIKFTHLKNYEDLKMLDFGSAIFHHTGSDTKHFDMAGSPYYVSPEMLANTGYDEKTDIWSAGVIFYKLLVGFFPFDAKTDFDIL